MKNQRMMATILILCAGPAFAQMPQPGAMFLTQWDDNADGRVTFDEARQRRLDMFEMFDQDSDGTLSQAEMDGIANYRGEMQAANRAAFGQPGMGQGRGIGPGGRAGMSATHDLLLFDADGDGTLTHAEFVQGTDAWFALMDRNGDAQITADDFGRVRR